MDEDSVLMDDSDNSHRDGGDDQRPDHKDSCIDIVWKTLTSRFVQTLLLFIVMIIIIHSIYYIPPSSSSTFSSASWPSSEKDFDALIHKAVNQSITALQKQGTDRCNSINNNNKDINNNINNNTNNNISTSIISSTPPTVSPILNPPINVDLFYGDRQWQDYSRWATDILSDPNQLKTAKIWVWKDFRFGWGNRIHPLTTHMLYCIRRMKYLCMIDYKNPVKLEDMFIGTEPYSWSFNGLKERYPALIDSFPKIDIGTDPSRFENMAGPLIMQESEMYPQFEAMDMCSVPAFHTWFFRPNQEIQKMLNNLFTPLRHERMKKPGPVIALQIRTNKVQGDTLNEQNPVVLLDQFDHWMNRRNDSIIYVIAITDTLEMRDSMIKRYQDHHRIRLFLQPGIQRIVHSGNEARVANDRKLIEFLQTMVDWISMGEADEYYITLHSTFGVSARFRLPLGYAAVLNNNNNNNDKLSSFLLTPQQICETREHVCLHPGAHGPDYRGGSNADCFHTKTKMIQQIQEWGCFCEP